MATGASSARDEPPPAGGVTRAGEEEPGEEDGGEADGAVDLAALRERWDAEAATVRVLEREGVSDDHPAMHAALAARDEAERAYRREKAPQPVARRIGWAQSRLDRAMRMQEKTLAQLHAFDAEAKVQRRKIEEVLEADRARISKHRAALEELQMEAGAEYFSPARGGDASRAACGRAAGGLRDAAPAALALADSLPEGSIAREQANALLAQLSALQSDLEQAASGDGGPEAFDISDEVSDWSESHDLGQRGGPRSPAEDAECATAVPTWRTSGHGRWQKGNGRQDGDGGTYAGKGSGNEGGEGGTASPPPPTVLAGPSGAVAETARLRTGAASSSAAPATGGGKGGGGAEAGDAAPPANKSRRGQSPTDSAEAAAAVGATRGALEVLRQQAAGAAAGFNTPAGVELAAQLHTRQVAEVVTLATAQGVQPITEDGQDLIMLGPEELRGWARLHLKGDEGAQYW